jgi:hypothetical protein
MKKLFVYALVWESYHASPSLLMSYPNLKKARKMLKNEKI